MKKRIYRHMLLLTLLCSFLLAAMMLLVFYQVFSRAAMEDTREKAELLASVVQDESNGFSSIDALDTSMLDNRLTVISQSGDVLFDNTLSSNRLESHADRAEFQQALTLGVGQSTRYSSTTGTLTFYYALRLPDGNVLRLARTIASIRGALVRAIPLFLLVCLVVFLLCNLIASRLARSIVSPISTMNLTSATAAYDELSPFVRTIQSQEEHIQKQLSALTQRSDLIRLIFQNMQEGFLLLDSHGNIQLANPFVLSLFGAQGEMQGRNIVELLRHMDILEGVKTALSGKHEAITVMVRERYFRVLLSPSPDQGAMLVFLDITETAKAEKQRTEFTANVSHELKTPLTSIYGYAEILNHGLAAPEDTQRFAAKIEEEAMRMIQLVEDIMKLSQLDETTRRPDMQMVDLGGIAEAVVGRLVETAQAHGVTISVRGVAPAVSANAAMMEELLHNLVENAIKYNRPGGQVWVSLEQSEGKTILEVGDTGIGIPTDQQERIFERFYRVEKSRSKKVGGTGLGLAIAKHIALVHGGAISVKSEEGMGTKVRVEL